MAFISEYGKAENDPGDWVEVGKDGDRRVRLRLRALPEDVRDSIVRRHTKQEKVDLPKGGRFIQPVASDSSAYDSMIIEQTTWCLLDSENLYIEPKDEEAAKAYGKALGREGQVLVGEEFCVDGKLTVAVKDLILRHNPQFRAVVQEQQVNVSKQKTSHMKALEGNS